VSMMMIIIIITKVHAKCVTTLAFFFIVQLDTYFGINFWLCQIIGSLYKQKKAGCFTRATTIADCCFVCLSVFKNVVNVSSGDDTGLLTFMTGGVTVDI
jgi:predicted small integral membrane protein